VIVTGKDGGAWPKSLGGIWRLSLLVGAAAISSCGDDSTIDDPSGAAEQFEIGERFHVSASRLNGRSRPSIDGEVIASIPNDADLTIDDRSGEWVRANWQADDVWVHADYLDAGRASQGLVGAPADGATKATIPTSGRSGSGSWFGKSCKKGKRCGNSCISRNKTCRK